MTRRGQHSTLLKKATERRKKSATLELLGRGSESLLVCDWMVAKINTKVKNLGAWTLFPASGRSVTLARVLCCAGPLGLR